MIWITAASLILSSFTLGMGVERALASYRVIKRETARYEFRMQLTRPLDLEPCEFSGFWQARG